MAPRAATDQTEQRAGLLADPARVVWCVVTDALEEVLLVVPVEGRLPDKHLVQQHTERPPIHGRVVQLPFENLKKHTTNRLG